MANAINTLTRDYDPTYLSCRGMEKHSWSVTHDHDDTIKPQWGFLVVQQCAHCETVRYAFFNPKTGLPVQKSGTWTYRYPTGYSIRGNGRISAVKFRQEWIKRTIDADKKKAKRKLTIVKAKAA